jgi:hypothetical protein
MDEIAASKSRPRVAEALESAADFSTDLSADFAAISCRQFFDFTENDISESAFNSQTPMTQTVGKNFDANENLSMPSSKTGAVKNSNQPTHFSLISGYGS